MNNNEQKYPQYGNWVSNKLIRKTVIASLFFAVILILLFVFPAHSSILLIVLKVICLLLAIFFLISTIYFIKAKQIFSYSGGKVQKKVLNNLIGNIEWNGKGEALDIGCGSGALTISLAKKYKGTKITGIDYWGANWGYCKSQCEKNAEIEGVGTDTEFIKASASKLPFDDETFDLVVSNLTFHEVGDCDKKTTPIHEALRVLKKGSPFVFQDLFMLESYFGTIEDLLDNIKNAGVEKVEFIDTSQLEFIPNLAKLPFMLGTMGILYGVK